jgi:multidrug efflux pump subunit AcrA (membrane-fusion protein)
MMKLIKRGLLALILLAAGAGGAIMVMANLPKQDVLGGDGPRQADVAKDNKKETAPRPRSTFWMGYAAPLPDAVGRVDPRAAAGSPVPFIEKIHVQEGQKVKKDQQVCSLRYLDGFADSLERAVKQAKANHEAATDILELAQINLRRGRRAGDSLAAEELTRREIAVRKASRDVASAKVAVGIAENNSSPFNPIAPTGGTVRRMRIKQGDAAVAFTDGKPWMLIVDESRLNVTVRVPRTEVGKLPKCVTVRSTVLKRELEGHITYIAPECDEDGGTPMTIAFCNAKGDFFVGDILEVIPTTDQKKK